MLLLATGCTPKPEAAEAPAGSPAALPALGSPRQIDPATLVYEIQLPSGKTTNHVWVYLPAKESGKKVPCVLIAPAGSRLFHGMALAEGDRLEHIPYVHAGFAVVAYELDGPLGDDPSEQQMEEAAKLFMASKAGLLDAQSALDYALAKAPQIDRDRIFIAGHSSAATHALLVASQDPRIKGCVAYAPAPDVSSRLGTRFVQVFDQRVKGFADFAAWASPVNHLSTLTCPVLLFHAKDDDVVPVSSSIAFAQNLALTNKRATLKLVDHGGHYDAMIKQGIPSGIQWLQKQAKASG